MREHAPSGPRGPVARTSETSRPGIGTPPLEWRSLLLGGWSGIVSLAAVGVAECVLAVFLTGGFALIALPFVVLVALIVGSPIVLAVGLPCAALLWRACSGVRHEAVHVALFGVLGAVLTLLALSAVILVASHGSPGRLDLVGPGLLALVLLPYGIAAAITTRIVAGRHAERLHVRRLAACGSTSTRREATMLDDGATTHDERLPDPRANEWGWGDIAVGWVVAHLALITVGFGLGMLTATEDPLARGAFHAAPATVWGTLVISLFGVPFGAWLATRLRPVRSGLVHLAAFGGLGAAGCLIHSAIMFPLSEASNAPLEFLAWFGWMCAHGVPAAVAARFAAKRWAIVMHDLRADVRPPVTQSA